jgi:hypothetical protein
MNNERFPSTIKLFFSIKHLESSLHWWIGSAKNNMISIFSAKSNNFRGEIFLVAIFIMIRSLKLLYI